VVADVTDKAAVTSMVERVSGELGRIDILVNNAEINIRKAPHNLELEEWTEVIDTNLNERLPLLEGGSSGHEGSGRRQGHQHRPSAPLPKFAIPVWQARFANFGR
jgi:2-deoxy-D-gluconate 3-dehydrogenase